MSEDWVRRPAGDGPKPRRRVFDLRVEEDVRREVAFHIEMKTEELVAEGWTRDAARAEAERRFGNVGEVEEECREITARQRRARRRASVLETVAQDIRFGLRTFLRRPAFTAIAVTTLALGVGANTAVFAVVERLLLAPLPFAEPDRLVRIWEVAESGAPMAFTEPNFLDLRSQLRSFTGLATHPTYWFGGPSSVLGGSEPVRRWAAWVSGDFFRIMAEPTAIGRVPEPDEAQPDAAPVVVVSHAFWSSILGAEADLSTLSVEIGSTRYAVVGVMPRGFQYPGRTDIWIPADPRTGGDRTSHNFAVVARLAPGVSAADAQREVSALMRRLRAEYGTGIDAVDARVTPLREELFGDYRRPLLMLLGAAGLVLLVACTNLASTWLARSTARQREFAVRISIGAGRARVVRQMLTESVILALLGGAAGIVVALLALRVLTATGPAGLLGDDTAGVGARVVAFTLAVSFVAAILFGLLPALRSTPHDLAGALREGGRTGSETRAFTWDALVVVEIALALVLLVASGLVMRGFDQLLDSDPGFDPTGLALASVAVPASRHPTDTAVAMVHERIIEALNRVPGVERAGLTSHVPFGGLRVNGGLELEGKPDAEAYSDYRAASPGYFEAMGIPLVEGRTFTGSDRIGTPAVAVVNRRFAERFYPGENVIGRRIRNLSNDSWVYGEEEWVTIIGLVGDVRHSGFASNPHAEVYVCSCQRAYWARNAVIALRTAGPHAAVVASVRQAIARIDADLPVEFSTMEGVIADSVAGRRFALLVLGSFSGLALVLAAIGIYGVVSYSVARRTREMGIRLALGAMPTGVVGMVVGRAMIVVLVGIVLGSLFAFATARLVMALLPGAGSLDVGTLAIVTALLAATALLASWLPARRVIRIDPIVTLRTE
jgi:putative ABC transport system permease protein